MGTVAQPCTSNRKVETLYRPRRPRETPLYKLVSEHFDEFERVYPERYQSEFGFWRPVIRESVEEYLKCGVPEHGFAKARCASCGHSILISFSCKKRCVCPSCHQKRVLTFAEHLAEEVLEDVPHRQFVFTIPKRFRLYFRYDRSLLGKLRRAAWETVKEVYQAVLEEKEAVPGMVATIQTFSSILSWNCHIHSLVSDGVWRKDGTFVSLPKTAAEPFLKLFEHKVFRLLLSEGRISEEVVESMMKWRHSGFSVHKDVYLAANDKRGIENLAQYIARCPFSLARMIKVTQEGNVLYRSEHFGPKDFPHWKSIPTLPGINRNFEVFKPLDFLAQMTQHIPDKYQNLTAYFGAYSCRTRGEKKKKAMADSEAQPVAMDNTDSEHDAEYRKAARRRWARLIKKVYEVDPLVCPKCGGKMGVIAFIEDEKTIRKILEHIGEYNPPERAPPNETNNPPPPLECEYVPAEDVA